MFKKLLVLSMAYCLSISTFATTDNSKTTGDPPARPVRRAKKALFILPISVSCENGIITITFNEEYSNVNIKLIKNGNIETSIYVGDMTIGDKQSITFSNETKSKYIIVVESDNNSIVEKEL